MVYTYTLKLCFKKKKLKSNYYNHWKNYITTITNNTHYIVDKILKKYTITDKI